MSLLTVHRAAARHSSANHWNRRNRPRNASGVERRRRPGITGAAGGNSGNTGLSALGLGPLKMLIFKRLRLRFSYFHSKARRSDCTYGREKLSRRVGNAVRLWGRAITCPTDARCNEYPRCTKSLGGRVGRPSPWHAGAHSAAGAGARRGCQPQRQGCLQNVAAQPGFQLRRGARCAGLARTVML